MSWARLYQRKRISLKRTYRLAPALAFVVTILAGAPGYGQ